VARLLIIEDDPKILRSLDKGLRAEGYEVATAADGVEGHRLAAAGAFDCVILDRMLPGRDGLEVLAELRRAGNDVPVLVLTARDAVEDRVAGLDGGADDYLVKPFAFAELLARLRVLLRRAAAAPETVLRVGDLEVDLLARRAARGGVEIPLAHREFEVLAYLTRHKEATVTREMLGRDVWKEPCHALTNVIDVYVNLLRKKLEGGGRPPLIHTVRGIGYRLGENPP
jgi:two-component system OmpR family response regulator